jgi:hypothetical protein
MIRSALRLVVAIAVIGGLGQALAQDNCPTCPGGANGCPPGANGHQLLHHRANAAAAAGFYPNGVTNYGYPFPPGAYAGPGGCRTCSAGQCQYRFYGQPDLFYNYYAWPSCTGVGAALYVSPRPVPPNVGHTFITYQPLYPHEFMYAHHRTYHRYYNGGQGLNRTSVHWVAPIFRN